MPIMTETERRFLTAVSRLAYCNPFLPERTEYERAALGRQFVSGGPVWSASVADPEAVPPNLSRLRARLEPVVERVRSRIDADGEAHAEELAIYEDSAQYLVFERYYPDFLAPKPNWRFYDRFAADWNHFFFRDPRRFETALHAAHMFACFRQVQRAFQHIFFSIIGNSMPAAMLRASVWQSVFTHDLRRYGRGLFRKMADYPTLITGPSGTGKELVARAIANSLYIPFDQARYTFSARDGSGDTTLIPINLAALSPTLIESELFGHRRGAFTGATADRKGWLDSCPPTGSIFLDELGELDLAIQVKLLRVLETRRFSAVGDTAVRDFSGKLIAATNRDLPSEIRAGRFREDLYYRLCADQIKTPSLREQIDDSPQVIHELLEFTVRRVVGNDAERTLAEVEEWIQAKLPRNYPWPGNYRELEQCVRNIIIRRSYQPMADPAKDHTSTATLLQRIGNGDLTVDELVSHYAALVYTKTGSYEETARRLGLDRRTVKSKVEQFLSSATG
jgi:transcriptional regulator with AAA-type ATPase domain